MSLPEDATLLQTCLTHSRYQEDVERAWAFLVFCGLVETTGHAAFLTAAKDKGADVLAFAEALLDGATRRAEGLDPKELLAKRLWQYFEVGRVLEAEAQEESTDPNAAPESTLDG